MTAQRPAFMHVTPDLDADLERLAQEKGIGQLVKPQPARPEEGPPDAAAPRMPKARPQPAPAEVAARSPAKNVNFQGPDYLWTALKIRAAEKQTSLRHVILTALRKDGFRIDDIDMDEDGRRPRP